MSEYENGFACEARDEDFTATAYRNSKGERRVTVEGTCSCNTEGFELTLKLASPPIVPVPEELHLDLVERAPDGLVPPVITPTPVKEEFPIDDRKERVVIRNRNITVPIKKE
ncbi:hypothetical protein [Streptomyces nojiriensis]|uniref:Uncharacterized protein n=1 Tax=Streptomyces nojiriensis TaxID=66374 RepID=A0ABQ3SH19_9ACTN|nr:hypothetical protein [Streptomyces nojiriensis]QTI49077.1 hypothetical protein JYK04_06947 [Streptomyces nojiriensis]GGS09263.1 hypothetical protein GCM10010205_43450 [Streptomyces nojiriensis]GHI67445.1 hypothetical protein Snoj_13630 [Streptomyces nojiriensis]